MTLSAADPRVQYTGNGSTTTFPFPFVFLTPSDIAVTIWDTVNLVTVAGVLNGLGTFDYTVTGTQDPTSGEYLSGGTVKFNTAPLSTYLIVLTRATPSAQTLALLTAGALNIAGINTQLDKLTMLAQQLGDQAGRAIAAPVTEPLPEGTINLIIPLPAQRASKILGFDSSGNVQAVNALNINAVNWRGAYNAGTTYAQGDGVASGGIDYVSLISGNLNNTPASSPSDWQALTATTGLFAVTNTYTSNHTLGASDNLANVLLSGGSVFNTLTLNPASFPAGSVAWLFNSNAIGARAWFLNVTSGDFSRRLWPGASCLVENVGGSIRITNYNRGPTAANTQIKLYVGPPTSATPWTINTAFTAQTLIANAGSLYGCRTGGTSAASGGGPTLTPKQSTVAISIGTPGVVTWNAHGLTANAIVTFNTNGALPTGINPGQRYFVVGSSITANTFQVSTTSGGAAVNTSGSQSGTHNGFSTCENITDNTVVWSYLCPDRPAWQPSTVYSSGVTYVQLKVPVLVTANGNIYQCTTGGTSASTGTGPSGTGATINDGSVVWEYVCGVPNPNNDGMGLDAPIDSFTTGAAIWKGEFDFGFQNSGNSVTLEALIAQTAQFHFPSPALLGQTGHVSLTLQGNAAFPCHWCCPPQITPIQLFDDAQAVLGGDLTIASIDASAINVTAGARLRSRLFPGNVNPTGFWGDPGSLQCYIDCGALGSFVADSVIYFYGGVDIWFLCNDAGYIAITAGLVFPGPISFIYCVQGDGYVTLSGTQTGSGETCRGTSANVYGGGRLADTIGLAGPYGAPIKNWGFYNFEAQIPDNSVKAVKPSNPAGTTSTSGVMCGLGSVCAINPSFSGRVRINVMGSMANGTAGNSCQIVLAFGTGAPPANGVAATGTTIGNGVALTNTPSATFSVPFNAEGTVGGLTLGTTYWFDLQQFSPTGVGTASVSSLTMSAEEF